jgi:hypothetical protein
MQIGAIFGGGLSPLLATQLNAVYGLSGVRLYVTVVAVISALCVMALKDAAGDPLDALDAARPGTLQEAEDDDALRARKGAMP